MYLRKHLLILIEVATLLAWSQTASAASTHVIFMSVDGLHGGLLETLLANDLVGDFENIQRLIDEGSSTLNARTDHTHTNTMPNHTSMLTGRPVLKPASQANTVHHDYTTNVDPSPTDTYHNAGNVNLSYIASVFDVAHDYGLSTAVYVSKSKFSIVDVSYDALNGGVDTVGLDDGRDKIDSYNYASDVVQLNNLFVTALNASPAHFNFVHYRSPDSAGHASGWGSPAWEAAVAEVDDRIGEVLDAITNSPTLNGRTAIVLTADHGGTDYGHGDATDPENYQIPFIVWGPDCTPGSELYALNVASRLNPQTVQRSYDAFPQPIRNGEAGNLALSLFGLPSIPGSTINAAQDLRIATPPTATPGSTSAATLSVAPNPFNPRTEIRLELPAAGLIEVSLYDAMGRRMLRIKSAHYSAGIHLLPLDARELASGNYFLRLKYHETALTQKVLLLK